MQTHFTIPARRWMLPAMSARGLLVLGLGALAGCGTGGDADADARRAIDADVDAPGRDCTPVIGDLSRPIEARPIYIDHRSEPVPIAADGVVELVDPPQGGQVLLVGLEARNVRGCAATITGRLRDEAGGPVLAEETRPSQLVLGADGWGHVSFPPIATTANLTACPMNGLPRDVDGNRWRLELAIVDDRDEPAAWNGAIVPTCWAGAPDPTICPCQCDADFVFGEPCPTDP